MSDDEYDSDAFGYESAGDEDVSIETLNESLINKKFPEYIKKNSKHEIDEDTFNLAIKYNDSDVLKQVIKLGAKPQLNSLDVAFTTKNPMIIKLTERECRNKLNTPNSKKISAEGTNNLIKTESGELYRLFVNDLTNTNRESLNLSILYSNGTTVMVDKMLELGCKPDNDTLDTAISVANVKILRTIMDLGKIAVPSSKNSIVLAIKTKNGTIVKMVQQFVGRKLNQSEMELFLQNFTEEDISKYDIECNLAMIPDIPEWQSYCVSALGLKELRKILVDVGIQQIENKSVSTLTKSEICKFLDGEYDIHKITIDNQLYRCINDTGYLSGQEIMADDDYLIDVSGNGMAYCLPKSDLQSTMSADTDYFAHPYTGSEMSPELLSRINTYVNSNPQTPKSLHQSLRIGDDLHLHSIKNSFSILKQYNRRIDSSIVNTYIQLDPNSYMNLLRELKTYLEMSQDQYNALYDCTLENKSMLLKNIIETQPQKVGDLSILLPTALSD